jgi:hypothetical protein
MAQVIFSGLILHYNFFFGGGGGSPGVLTQNFALARQGTLPLELQLQSTLQFLKTLERSL